MKKFILLTGTAILSMGIISESRADYVWDTDCGEDCSWEIIPGTNGNTLKITGKGGAMKDFGYSNPGDRYTKHLAPWNREENNITSVIVDGVSSIGNSAFEGMKIKTAYVSGVETIGELAFSNSSLESIDLTNAKIIGADAFYQSYNLTTVNTPNVESIGDSAFSFTKLESIDLPNVTSIGKSAFDVTSLEYIGLPQTDNEGCLVNQEGKRLIKDNNSCITAVDLNGGVLYLPSNVSGDPDIECGNKGFCGSCGDKFIKSGAGCVSDCGEGYTPDNTTKQCVKKSNTTDSPAPGVGTQPTASSCANDGKVLQSGKCVSSCGSSFRLNDGECDRIRYTPAEATKVLKDSDNEIIMTFKVNR